MDSSFVTHGWFLSKGTYRSFDVAGALNTQVLGINDAGNFVETYNQSGTSYLPFVDPGGVMISLDLGFATTSASATAISSNNLVTGNYRVLGDPLTHGFIRAADGTRHS